MFNVTGDKARSAQSRTVVWSHQLLRSERSWERRGRMGTRETQERAEICLACLAPAWLRLWAGLHSKLGADFITPQRLCPLSGRCEVNGHWFWGERTQVFDEFHSRRGAKNPGTSDRRVCSTMERAHTTACITGENTLCPGANKILLDSSFPKW